MNRDKQIEKMGVVTDLLIDFDEMGFAPTTLCPDPEAYAIEWKKKLVNALKGYRKASEVAREIFGAVDSTIDLVCAMTGLDIAIFGKYAELKKKYTESEKDNG